MHKLYILFIAGLICSLSAIAGGKTTVGTLEGLQAALSNSDVDTVVVSQCISITTDITLDGNGKTVQVVNPYVGKDGKALGSGYSSYGVLNLTANVTLRNMTVHGGYNADAIIISGKTLTAENVTVSRSYRGLNLQGSTAILKNCNIVRNVGPNGAGILVRYSTLVMDGCSLSENRVVSSGLGGGAMEVNRGVLYANNTVIANNSAPQAGGAINNYGGHTYIMNCTLSGNSCIRDNGSSEVKAYLGGAMAQRGRNFYAVNTIFKDNYFCDELSSTKQGSDIGADFAPWDGYSTNTVEVNLYNCLYGSLVSSSNSHTINITDCKNITDESPVFAAYREDGVLKLKTGTTQSYKHPVAVSKDSSNPFALYIPTGTTSQTGGCYTYFDYSDLASIKMGYSTDNGNTIISIIPSVAAPDADKRVTTYYEGGTRNGSQIGASGVDTRNFYTLKLSNSTRNCNVQGVTVFGDSYPSGTEITVKATPYTGYSFFKWIEQGDAQNLSDADSYTITLTDNLTIQPVVGYHFSENDVTQAQLEAVSGNTEAVRVGRTFYKDGGYNTICLPFSLTAEAIAASPLAGYTKLQEFSSATVVNAGEVNETLVLTLSDVTAIEAGKPYIITWESGENIVNPVFDGVTVTATAGTNSSTVNNVTFCGTLVPYAVEADNLGVLFVGDGGNLHWPNVSGDIKGMRGYFTVNLGGNNAPARGARAIFGDAEDATAISTVAAQQNTARVQKLIENGRVVIISNGQRYNMNGQIIK